MGLRGEIARDMGGHGEVAVRPEWRRLVVCAHLRRLAASSSPILVGPWRSEVGFEALYWLPFLRWAVQYAKLNPKRLVVVSRGGAGALYGAPAVDLYQLRSVEAVRRENVYDWTRAKVQKQMRCTPWDRDVLREAAAQALGRRERYHVLHPSWMYWALEPFWEEHRGLRHVSSMTDFAPLATPPVTDVELPPKYVAMKWYDRATFSRADAKVQEAVAQITGIVGAQTHIVMLSSGLATDEHADFEVQHPRIVRLPVRQPDQNLWLQIQVLGRAAAFVGTYGGMAQMALRLRVPSASFYESFGGTAYAHLSLSHMVGIKTHVPFLTGNFEDANLWRQIVSVPVAGDAQNA